jgi:hypothetical protein
MSAEHKGNEPWPPRPVLIMGIAALLMVTLGMGWMLYMQVSTTADKNVAQANSKTLAQDIQRVCSEQGALVVDDRDLCAKASQVEKAPTEAIPGPKGDPGKDGRDGLDSTAPGPTGRDGAPGKDSTVPGPAGQDGADSTISGPAGADSTVPGPAGRDGKVGVVGRGGIDGAPGADSTIPGPAGPQGEPGRGITSAYCGDDGRWIITYTDGAVQDGGQCRATSPIGVLP